jgi:hypothetical protein
MQISKCKVQNESHFIFKFALCILHFAIFKTW